MFDSSKNSSSTRQNIIDAALADIERAARGGRMVSLADECKKLAERYPDSDLTEEDLRELVASLAVKHRANVAFD